MECTKWRCKYFVVGGGAGGRQGMLETLLIRGISARSKGSRECWWQHTLAFGIIFETLGGAHRALCARGAESRLFFTTLNHGSQGPEFCIPAAVVNGSCVLL